MADYGDEYTRPEFNASFLFLVELQRSFQRCNIAREKNNPQLLLRHLESISLSLVGFYPNDETFEDIKRDIQKARIELNEIVQEFEETEELKINEAFRELLFNIEYKLECVYSASGLKMKMGGSSGESIPDY